MSPPAGDLYLLVRIAPIPAAASTAADLHFELLIATAALNLVVRR